MTAGTVTRLGMAVAARMLGDEVSWYVERQFGAEWGIAASYLGSYTDRLWLQIQENPGVFLGTGPCTINGVSYNVCSTAANLNQRRVLSVK